MAFASAPKDDVKNLETRDADDASRLTNSNAEKEKCAFVDAENKDPDGEGTRAAPALELKLNDGTFGATVVLVWRDVDALLVPENANDSHHHRVQRGGRR